jgi:hypothetical protein
VAQVIEGVAAKYFRALGMATAALVDIMAAALSVPARVTGLPGKEAAK